MAITYSYTNGDTSNLNRLRYLLGDNRGVVNTYATNALWVANASALHTDEELLDALIIANGGSTPAVGSYQAIHAAARIALQCRANKEAMGAGVSGTTDTTDRPAAIINALRALESLAYYPAGLPDSTITANTDLDDAALTDMGDET